MTREEAKDLWSIIKAYADGEGIEVWSDAHEAWIPMPMDNAQFNEDLKYRVASQNEVDYRDMTSCEKEKDDLYSKHLEKQMKWKFHRHEKVVVRNKDSKWGENRFSHYDNDCEFPYVCVLGCCQECVPYNEITRDLVGTTKDFII